MAGERTRRHSGTDATAPSWQLWAWPIAAALLALAVFAPSLRYGFAYDDRDYIVLNPLVTEPFDPIAAITGPFTPQAPRYGLYRPLTSLSFQLDARGHERVAEPFHRWGGTMPPPAPFHRTNLLLHAVVSGLVFLVGVRCWGWGKEAVIGAGLAAVLFAVHPLHIEVVANPTGRSELLATLFFLAAWLAFDAGYTARSLIAGRMWIAWATLALLLSLGAKETAVTFPLMIMATAWLRDRQPPAMPTNEADAPTAEKLPFLQRPASPALLFFLIACALNICYLLTRSTITGFLTVPDDISYFGARPELSRWWSAPAIFLFNLRLFAVPLFYYPDYNFPLQMLGMEIAPISGPGNVWSWLGLIAFGACLAWYIWAMVRRRPIAWALSWWFLPLSLFLHIIPFGEIAADRMLYLPSVGFCLAIGYCAAKCVSRRRVAGIGAALLVLGLSAITFVQQSSWENDRTFYEHVATNPNNPEGPSGIATVNKFEASALLERVNDADAKLSESERAAMRDRATQLIDEALQQLDGWEERYPDHYRGLISRGELIEMSATEDSAGTESLRLFEEVYSDFFPELGADRVAIAIRVGSHYLRNNQLDEAITWGRRATRGSQPDSATVRQNAEALLGEALRRRAVALAESDGLNRAEAAFRDALKEAPGYAPLYLNLAELFESQNRWAEAEQVWARLVSRNPGSTQAQQRLQRARQMLIAARSGR